MASDFSWVGQPESPGVINAGQRFVASVPEPSTLALMAVGLAGIGFSRKRVKA